MKASTRRRNKEEARLALEKASADIGKLYDDIFLPGGATDWEKFVLLEDMKKSIDKKDPKFDIVRKNYAEAARFMLDTGRLKGRKEAPYWMVMAECMSEVFNPSVAFDYYEPGFFPALPAAQAYAKALLKREEYNPNNVAYVLVEKLEQARCGTKW